MIKKLLVSAVLVLGLVHFGTAKAQKYENSGFEAAFCTQNPINWNGEVYPGITQECQALAELYATLNGENWQTEEGESVNWGQSEDLSDWQGLYRDEATGISRIELVGNTGECYSQSGKIQNLQGDATKLNLSAFPSLRLFSLRCHGKGIQTELINPETFSFSIYTLLLEGNCWTNLENPPEFYASPSINMIFEPNASNCNEKSTITSNNGLGNGAKIFAVDIFDVSAEINAKKPINNNEVVRKMIENKFQRKVLRISNQ